MLKSGSLSPVAGGEEKGRVYEVIVDRPGRERASLIVMAGHIGMDRFTPGGNAERVVRHGRCAVLPIRPEGDG